MTNGHFRFTEAPVHYLFGTMAVFDLFGQRPFS